MYVELMMEIHEHCHTCINLLKCQRRTSKNTPQCDVVHCKQKCGASFHACKEDEHKLICHKEKVKCINAEYGCPVILERQNRGRHLKVCPASVVHCTMTYDHWPIPLVDNAFPVKSCDSSEVNSVDQKLPKNATESTELDSSLNLSTFSDVSVSVRNSCLLWKSFKPFTLNPTEPYTFTCARDFQRVEFEWHFRNTHSDLQSCLYDWVEQWCPLAQYGCKFTRQRLQPCLQANRNYHTKVSSKVVFSQKLQAFGMTENHINNSHSISEERKGSQEDRLSQLPNEVLLVIAGHLDSFSLNNLSMTSPRFYAICQSLLTQKGIVLPQWKKQGTSWQIVSYEWKFTTACAPVYNWFVTDCPPMSSHMRQCPHFASYLKTKDDSFIQGNEENRGLLMSVINEYAEYAKKRSNQS